MQVFIQKSVEGAFKSMIIQDSAYGQHLHVLGFLERKLGHLIKANHHYAILATYHTTQKGYRALQNKEQ